LTISPRLRYSPLMDVTDLDLATASALLAERRLSSVELVRGCLARIEALDGVLHCFVTLTPDTALAAADASDERATRRARLGPLDGIPLALKDNIDVAGVPTTNGIGARRGAVATDDAEVVRRLRRAGAVILGKCAMQEAAFGGTGDNPHFGRTANPHRLDHSPGGSSSGSGAAVAARLCPAALGTDTLGSVRLPAAYCGVLGIKPTFGLVSTRGVVPLCWTFDHVGVLARSARDLGLVLDAMAGYDPESAESRQAPPGWRAAVADDGRVNGLVLGRPRAFDALVVNPEIASAWEQALDLLAELGCTVREVELPGYDPERARRAAVLLIEAEGAVAHGEILAREPNALSPDVRVMLEYGRDASAERLVRAGRVLAGARLAARQALAEVDALALPAACETAFPFSAPAPATQAVLTALANIAGLPAVSVPMGVTRTGLPMGLQIVGRRFAEATVLVLASAYERAAAWDLRPRALG
jgi:aspartyl-tRNA(Asn)/glutamyl-tRNA(Gln) amidotransferase subunit A